MLYSDIYRAAGQRQERPQRPFPYSRLQGFSGIVPGKARNGSAGGFVNSAVKPWPHWASVSAWMLGQCLWLGMTQTLDMRSTVWINWGFPKVDHSGRSARIVLEQINSAKKTTSNRTWTLDPRTVCTTHFLSLMPYPCPRSHCLKDWDLNDPYVGMLYLFQLNPLSSSKFRNQ